MVEMIKELTGTQIVVGQNGIVWVKGENESIAAEAILLIEQRSHIQGLTDQIKEILEKKLKTEEKKTAEKTEEKKTELKEEIKEVDKND